MSGAAPTTTLSEQDARSLWNAEAREQTLETLPAFLDRLTKHPHDYGTICVAIGAAAHAAARAMDKSPAGGITGFQAGAIMWEFVQQWMSMEGKPLRLVDYHDLLYPQYASKFTSIHAETWDAIQKEAASRIAGLKDDSMVASSVYAHWQSIVAGNVPFGLTVEGRS